MRWETGTVVPEGAKGLLHTAELEYFHKYDSLVTEYMGHYGLDLTAVRAAAPGRDPLVLASPPRAHGDRTSPRPRTSTSKSAYSATAAKWSPTPGW